MDALGILRHRLHGIRRHLSTRDLSVTIVANSHTAQPWLLVVNALPLLDASLRAVPAAPVRNADTVRTPIAALIRGDLPPCR